MPLPVLSAARAASDADLLRLFHKTERAWAEHLGEPTQLDAGVAVVAADLPGVWDANRVLEAAVPPGGTAADAVAEVEAHFAALAAAGSPPRCGEWVLNPAAPPGRTGPLGDYLLTLGYRAVANDVMALGPAARPDAPTPSGVTVLPARAALRHAEALAAEAAGDHPAVAAPAAAAARPGTPAEAAAAATLTQWIDAHLRHLDDPHVDALLALRAGRAVGRALVLAVGDVGRVEDLYVAPAARRQGVGRLLLARAMEVCARSAFRHVLLGVHPDNGPAAALYRAFGFRKVGTATAYYRGADGRHLRSRDREGAKE